MTWMDLWGPIHASRWDWADRQIDRFARDLDPTLRGYFLGPAIETPQPSAVLFGKTQVGKTTLILRMMGIDAKQLKEVGDVLRHGHSRGLSSTAAATRYSWSVHQDLWVIQREGFAPQDLDREGTRAVLKDERRRLLDGRASRGVLEIGIPTRYRDPESPLVTPRILDLPGAHAASSAERKHAEDLIRHHVSTAQLVIMVARADDLDSLYAGLAKSMLELSMWTVVPERFRIVLTRTISNLAGQPSLLDAGAASVSWLREHLLGQLRRGPGEYLLGNDDAMLERIAGALYPIEYGDSWQSLRSRKPRVYKAFSPVLGQLFNELTGAVSNEDMEDARRISMVHAAKTLELVANRELDKRSRDLKQIRSRELKSQMEYEAGKAKARLAKNSHEQAKALISSLRDAESYSFSRQIAAGASKGSSSLIGVIELGNDRAAFLREHWDEVWSKWRRSAPVNELVRKGKERPPDKPARADKEFRARWDCCGRCAKGKVKQRVLRRSSLELCMDKQERAWKSSQLGVAKQMEIARSAWAEVLRQRLEPDLEEKRVRLGKTRQAAESSQQQVEEAGREIADRERDIEEFRKNVTRAERNLTKLRKMLDAGLEAEFKYRNRAAEQAGNEEEKLAQTLAALLAIEESARMEKAGT